MPMPNSSPALQPLQPMPGVGVSSGNFDLGAALTKILPAIGGIEGAVLGSAGGPVGTIAGGVVGQGAGDVLEDLVTGKDINAQDLLKQALQGGILGALPGGEEADVAETGVKAALDSGADRSGIGLANKITEMATGKVAKRAVTGGAFGAGTQAIQQFDPNKPFGGENLQNLVGPAIGGAAGNVIAGGAFDALGAVGKVLGKDLPTEIRNAIGDRQSKLGGYLVGANNIDFAVARGIIPKDIDTFSPKDIEDSYNKAVSEGGKQDQIIQDKLKNTPGGKEEAREKIAKEAADTFRKANAEDIEKYLGRNWNKTTGVNVSGQMVTPDSPLYASLLKSGKIPTEEEQAANVWLNKMLPRENLKAKNFDAALMNKVRQATGKTWNKGNDLVKDLYNFARTKTEDLSGDPEGVRALSKEAQKLIYIKQALKENYTDVNKGALADRFKEGANISLYKSPKLTGYTSIANGILTMLAYASPARFIGYIVARGMEPAIDRKLITPKFADALSSAYNQLSTKERQQVLSKIFSQLGIRIGANQ